MSKKGDEGGATGGIVILSLLLLEACAESRCRTEEAGKEILILLQNCWISATIS